MKMKLRKDDQVMVIAGNDKGTIGKILEIDPKSLRVIVEGVNLRKKHLKKSQQHPEGKIIELERPIHYSNVMACPKEKPVKLFARNSKSNEKEYCYKSGGKTLVYRKVKSKGKK